MTAAIRYRSNLPEFCRRLHRQNDLSPYQLRKRLLARGIDPCPAEDTIRCWVDPGYAEARALRKRTGRCRTRRRGYQRRLARMRELREEVGLSFRAIAALMSHDFEDIEITEEQARSILNGTTSEPSIRKLLWPYPKPSERSRTA